jgi:hypothetical protein
VTSRLWPTTAPWFGASVASIESAHWMAPPGKKPIQARARQLGIIGTISGYLDCHVSDGNREETMKVRAIAIIAALALGSTSALAQTGNSAGGSSQAGGPAGSKTTTGDSMDGSTTGERGTDMKNRPGNSPTTGMGSGSSAPSSSGNVGPGTNNNSGPQPGGR